MDFRRPRTAHGRRVLHHAGVEFPAQRPRPACRRLVQLLGRGVHGLGEERPDGRAGEYRPREMVHPGDRRRRARHSHARRRHALRPALLDAQQGVLRSQERVLRQQRRDRGHVQLAGQRPARALGPRATGGQRIKVHLQLRGRVEREKGVGHGGAEQPVAAREPQLRHDAAPGVRRTAQSERL